MAGTNNQQKGKTMLKYVTTLKLEHTIDTTKVPHPRLLSMTDEERQEFFDMCAKSFIASTLIKANEGSTYALLNLVKE